jgi:hypothetical protein
MADGNGALRASAFISYAHDSAEHREDVRRLWYFLNENGVTAWADLGAEDRRQDWPRRVEEKLADSDYILIVASPEYHRRVNRPSTDPDGRGVEYEAALIRDRLISDRERWHPRILPVLLPGHDRAEIPEFLAPWSSTFYRVRSFTVDGALPLLRILIGQPAEGGPASLPPPVLPRQPAPMDSRSRVLDDLVDQLSTLPAVQSTGGRATFAEMIQARLDIAVGADTRQPPAAFLREVISLLAGRPGALTVIADVVRALHHSQPIEQAVRHTIERWEILG